MNQFTINITTSFDFSLNKTVYTVHIFKTKFGTTRHSFPGNLSFETVDNQLKVFQAYSMQELLSKIESHIANTKL
jgi:hypothetical protein